LKTKDSSEVHKLMAVQALTHAQRVTRLYRRSLKHLLSWHISRAVWREEAMELRAWFDENKYIKDYGEANKMLEIGEAEFEKRKHPDPYICKFV